MTALMFLIGVIIVGGIAGFAFVKAHDDATGARREAALAAKYNYRACIDRNEMKSVTLTLVEAQLAAGRLDPIERAVFQESIQQLRPSDCLSIRRGK